MIHAKETLPNGETRLKWTPATINRYFSALRRIFTLAVIDGKISRHPMKGVKFCRNPNRTAFSQMWNLTTVRPVDDARGFSVGPLRRGNVPPPLRAIRPPLAGCEL
jgi:hypothetical protein